MLRYLPYPRSVFRGGKGEAGGAHRPVEFEETVEETVEDGEEMRGEMDLGRARGVYMYELGRSFNGMRGENGSS